MSTQDKPPRRPGLVARWFFRAPVALYRIGLGGLMPTQLLLTTVGRRSGRPHRAVVDILEHDGATGTYYVGSAYGANADWYRNLKANPAVRVQIGRRMFAAQAGILDDERAAELVLKSRREQGRWRRLYERAAYRLVGLRADTEEDVRASLAEIKVVAIRAEPQ